MTSLRTDRTALGRARERGSHARDDVHAVLDSALVCHLAVTTADGPLVLPTIHARVGDVVYVHGSVAARWLGAQGQVCLTATLVDGLVLARSAFHHSMNYRSVVVRGAARVVTDADEVDLALHAITEHVLPGRWDVVRTPSRKELAATTVLALDLREASVKARTGPPNDDQADLDADGAAELWAGVLPIRTVFGAPQPDDLTAVEAPAHLALAGTDVDARRDPTFVARGIASCCDPSIGTPRAGREVLPRPGPGRARAALPSTRRGRSVRMVVEEVLVSELAAQRSTARRSTLGKVALAATALSALGLVAMIVGQLVGVPGFADDQGSTVANVAWLTFSIAGLVALFAGLAAWIRGRRTSSTGDVRAGQTAVGYVIVAVLLMVLVGALTT